MEDQSCQKLKLDRQCKEVKDAVTSTKTTGAKLKERWLLTRKTWRYMNDAGKKLFPDGTHPHKHDDVPKIEEHFQNVCQTNDDYILWDPNKKPTESSPTEFTDEKYDDHYADDYRSETDGLKDGPYSGRERLSSSGDLGYGIPLEWYHQLLKSLGASTLHRVATRLMEEQLMEEDEFGYEDDESEYIEVDGRTMRSVGVQTDPYLDMCVQTDHDENAEDMVKVGAETRAETEAAVAFERALMHEQLQKEMRQGVAKGHESGSASIQERHSSIKKSQFTYEYIAAQHGITSTEQQAINFQLSSMQKSPISPTLGDFEQQGLHQFALQQQTLHQQGLHQQNLQKHGTPPGDLQSSHAHAQHQQQPIQQQQQHQQEFQHQQVSQPPVLRKFWARRESLTAKNESKEQFLEKVCTEKDREGPLPKGSVAAKLASIEAAASISGSSTPTETGLPKLETIAKSADASRPTQQHQPQERKKQQNVFKLGLKCDIEGQPSLGKVAIEKAQMDKFKTVNYDKTLRNIKSKWVPNAEEEEYLRELQKSNEEERERVKEMKKKEKERLKILEKEERMREKEEKAREKEEKAKEKEEKAREKAKEKIQEKEKKKKKARSIQVGEPLPQFILNSLRINSPVEIIHATKKRFRRLSSKAESADLSESECSVPPSGMMSPRFNVSVLDDHGHRDLLVSETEAYKLSQMGIPFVYKRSSFDTNLDSNEFDPVGRSSIPPHQFHRSLSAVQASGHISQMLYNLRTGRFPHPLGGMGSGGSSMSMGGKSGGDRSLRLTQILLHHLLPAVMQRPRSSGGGHASRLVAKRIWRTRSKSQSRASAGTTSIWTPMGNCTWMSVTGRVTTLDHTTLLHLTELERLALQGVSSTKLQSLNLGCPIRIPKESSSISSTKKRKSYLLKRKGASTGKDETKGMVFGVPLNKCLENEKVKLKEAAEREAIAMAAAVTPLREDGDGSWSRKSSQAGSFTSLLDGTKQSITGSLESLNFDRKRPSLGGGDVVMNNGSPSSLDLLAVEQAQVPSLVSTCCKHLENHGLKTLGIFRVSSSKKRVRQLREEFDCGKEVLLNEEHCPHDVATLLKEFFRDLPEPLLTRELYEPLLQTQKIRNRRLQFEALQYLVQLLPTANRDTLHTLLNFLTTVAEHASNSDNEGNKMDSNNLATLFAPNILHQIKPGSETLTNAEMTAQAEERMDVINVVRCMIDHNKELFEVSAELLDETYLHLMDSHPEALDVLLRKRCTSMGQDEGHSQPLLSCLGDSSGIRCVSFPTPPLMSTSNVPYGLDLEIDNNSSVFEGSEASSPMPRSPTDLNDFERLRTSVVNEEIEGKRKDSIGYEDALAERIRRRRKYEEEESSNKQSKEKRYSGDIAGNEEKGWFRRREKSGSREFERGSFGDPSPPERNRWFKKREKTSPKLLRSEEHMLGRFGSGKKAKDKTNPSDSNARERIGSQDSVDSQFEIRLRGDQVIPHERLKVPEPSVRRLSSPELDHIGVITASLKIPVPSQQQASSLSFTQETNIPYIENNRLSEEEILRLRDGTVTVSTSRQRTGSNDSYLGQPITGAMSFQPLNKKEGEKQSNDSILSTSSRGVYTMTPSDRNTPISDFQYASGASTPQSGILSPPMCISPDSGTPGLSPPNSPPIQRRKARNKDDPPVVLKPAPLTHSATHTFGSKTGTTHIIKTKEKVLSSKISGQPLGRSRTVEALKLENSTTTEPGRVQAEIRSREEGGTRIARIGFSQTGGGSDKDSVKRYVRRRNVGERQSSSGNQTPSDSSRTVNTESNTQLWKRWEIIASDPAEPETFV